MSSIKTNIGKYLACHEDMAAAENHIREYFSSMGLPDTCVDNSIKYLQYLRSDINNLEEQIEIATKRFTQFKCTSEINDDVCCFLTEIKLRTL